MENFLKACENYCKTRKVTGFKSLQLKYWEINRQHQNAKLIFGQNLQKRSKIEKVNINIKFYIFKLVYSWVLNRRGFGINVGRGWKIENLIPGCGGRNFIWCVKIEYKEAEVFWVANDLQNTSSSSVRSSSTFNKNINKHSITSVKSGQ